MAENDETTKIIETIEKKSKETCSLDMLNEVSKDLIDKVTAHFAEKEAAKAVEGVVMPESSSSDTTSGNNKKPILEIADLIVGDTHKETPKEVKSQVNHALDTSEENDKSSEENKKDDER